MLTPQTTGGLSSAYVVNLTQLLIDDAEEVITVFSDPDDTLGIQGAHEVLGGADVDSQFADFIPLPDSLEITPEESSAISATPIAEVHAYESFLRARQEMYRFSEEGLERALQEARNGLEILGENPLLLSIIGSCYVQYINQGFSSKKLGDFFPDARHSG